MEIMNFNYFLALWYVNLFLWYHSFRICCKSPRDYMQIFFAISAYVISGRILNDYSDLSNLPLILKITFFMPMLSVLL